MAITTYQVNPESFLVEIFSDETGDVPFISQPQWPNGDSWESAEEADAWAQEFIAFSTRESNIPPRSFRDDQPEPFIFDDPAAAPVEGEPSA